MSQVAAVKTPVTLQDFYAAILRAWPAVIGGSPSHASILVLLAQSAFETGYWKSLFAFNFGNAKHVPGDGYDYYVIPCGEIIDGQNVNLPACEFRAFDSLDAGVTDYLKMLRNRFSSAWPAVEAGDPAQFAHLLKLKGYYTDTEAHYTSSLVSIFNSLKSKVKPMTMAEAAALGGGSTSHVGIAFAGVAVGVAAFFGYEALQKKRGHR